MQIRALSRSHPHLLPLPAPSTGPALPAGLSLLLQQARQVPALGALEHAAAPSPTSGLGSDSANVLLHPIWLVYVCELQASCLVTSLPPLSQEEAREATKLDLLHLGVPGLAHNRCSGNTWWRSGPRPPPRWQVWASVTPSPKLCVLSAMRRTVLTLADVKLTEKKRGSPWDGNRTSDDQRWSALSPCVRGLPVSHRTMLGDLLSCSPLPGSLKTAWLQVPGCRFALDPGARYFRVALSWSARL